MDFALTPPEPVTAIPSERAAGLITLSEDTRSAVSVRASEFASRLEALDVRSPEFTDLLDELLTVGEADMRAAAGVAGTMLDRSLRSAASPQDGVTTSLASLRRTVAELDPAKLPLTGRKLLGVFPVAAGAKRALDRYRAANEPVNALVVDLRGRQDVLRRDNASIKGERERLWKVMGKLAEAAALAEAVDGAIEAQAGVFDLTDPARANALRADVLYPIRQRHQDLLTQLAVSAQGYLALDLVRKNNDELIRGVERAVSTTVSALRVALLVSGALASQRDVLDEVAALQATTDGLIRANTELLDLQSAEIRRASSDPAVATETIRQSFDRIYASIDAIDGFRADAVRTMATTVESLSGEIRRAEDHLRRSHEGEA
ncbi:toxic anion resistance family protein [Amycolatopsis mediterranei S699]|uniref:Toxic anion resistance family protein n=3 Tax=Amycolatopsis mediterranei TaxID=33910 RepID=A0A0H3CZE1_AMYMU|nr:toxic anion resistance protein [Amycolatopsis mediterranei]ADJ43289.1 toxic anion resistance family protein [Amycolatopsis mediterranei U32]AEK39990.1 toxic anion resistance family protein [Amycolatopsis mediterranei S699]AFO75002.1 toxic anion resistance family protein [Amycolatopsis mediterranei S699]AGT82131.1 toxic anion resistance family protein [Amycolatopsis mediterranei RB]KDO11122.1 toxic anion resistance protein [Amycolatopsis mediterranei]